MKVKLVISPHGHALHFRRIRGDMIETYNILTVQCDVAAVPTLVQACTYVTRGNNLRLRKPVSDMMNESNVLLTACEHGTVYQTGLPVSGISGSISKHD